MRRQQPSGTIRRVQGYARVSSEEQARGTSLQDQQDAIRREATARGLEVARYFVEAESAVHERIERREQIRALMHDVREGDLVLCDKLDRWSRDPEFTYGSIRQILERGASFYAVGDRCDPSTKDGDTMLGVRVLVAREEHKRIRERTVGTRKLLRDRGYYVEGLPPLGYKRRLPKGRRGPDKNVLEIIPEQADVVREAFKRCADGASIGDVRDWLVRKTGRRTWDKKSVAHILRNRLYLGEISDSRGVWIKGQHDAIVDAKLFRRAQEAISNRRLGGAHPREDSRTASWLVRGLAVCAKCGGHMGASYGGGPKTGAKQYTFYLRCVRMCGARYVPVFPADAAVGIALLEHLESFKSELARESRLAPKRPDTDFAERRERIRRKRERYLEAYADGDMTKAELREALSRLDDERTKLDAKESEAEKASPAKLKELHRSVLALAGQIRKAWGAALPSYRRELLALFAKSVRLERDKPPIVEWRPLEELADRTSLGLT